MICLRKRDFPPTQRIGLLSILWLVLSIVILISNVSIRDILA